MFKVFEECSGEVTRDTGPTPSRSGAKIPVIKSHDKDKMTAHQKKMAENDVFLRGGGPAPQRKKTKGDKKLAAELGTEEQKKQFLQSIADAKKECTLSLKAVIRLANSHGFEEDREEWTQEARQRDQKIKFVSAELDFGVDVYYATGCCIVTPHISVAQGAKRKFSDTVGTIEKLEEVLRDPQSAVGRFQKLDKKMKLFALGVLELSPEQEAEQQYRSVLFNQKRMQRKEEEREACEKLGKHLEK